VRAVAGDTLVEVTEVADPCHVGTLYFAHNSADLDSRSASELERIAACVSRERGMPVHLVGSADPRGTEEYNLALGERRAQSVRNYLVDLGVDSRLLTFATVGEEFARGTSEATWALDRHVEPMVHETSRGLRRPDEGYSHALDRPRIQPRAAHE
jgi:peptidoglycan-associated lipoprotein